MKTFYLVLIDTGSGVDIVGEDGAIGNIRILFSNRTLDGEVFDDRKSAVRAWGNAKEIDESVVIKKVRVF